MHLHALEFQLCMLILRSSIDSILLDMSYYNNSHLILMNNVQEIYDSHFSKHDNILLRLTFLHHIQSLAEENAFMWSSWSIQPSTLGYLVTYMKLGWQDKTKFLIFKGPCEIWNCSNIPLYLIEWKQANNVHL